MESSEYLQLDRMAGGPVFAPPCILFGVVCCVLCVVCVNNLPRVVTWKWNSRKSNPRPLAHESDALTITPPWHRIRTFSPGHFPLYTPWHTCNLLLLLLVHHRINHTQRANNRAARTLKTLLVHCHGARSSPASFCSNATKDTDHVWEESWVAEPQSGTVSPQSIYVYATANSHFFSLSLSLNSLCFVLIVLVRYWPTIVVWNKMFVDLILILE